MFENEKFDRAKFDAHRVRAELEHKKKCALSEALIQLADKEDTRALLKETWMECVNDYFIPQLAEYEAGLLKKFAESGVTVIESLADYDKWVEAVVPVWAKYGAGMEDLIAKAQANK